ncbi:MAG: hypothetical protein H6Q54_639, partial [Deltaproteobacteria bacterium]|nr:hypothetical protein [Deltaproteobacteria bacterium]
MGKTNKFSNEDVARYLTKRLRREIK